MKRRIQQYFFLGFLFISLLRVHGQSGFDFTIQGGYNILNVPIGNNGSVYSASPGFPSLYVESHFHPFEAKKEIGIGGGFAFHHIRSSDTDLGWLWTYSTEQVGSLFYWPLYLSFKYDLNSKSNLSPYTKWDIGYTFFEVTNNVVVPDDRVSDPYYWGGFYTSFSGGITLAKKICIEANVSLLTNGISTEYQYNGYWSTWKEPLKVIALTISAGITL